MNIPCRSYSFAAGLRCPIAEVPDPAWQAHVIRHPFGMGALMWRVPGKPRTRSWNEEGWDRTAPPVITADLRRELVAAVRSLRIEGEACRAPRLESESYSGEPVEAWRSCYECPRPLACACDRESARVGGAYRDVVDQTLEMLAAADGVVVPRRQVFSVLTSLYRLPLAWEGLAILTVGTMRGADGRVRLFVRVNRWDGLRAEFYLDGDSMRWRTTYRLPDPSLAGRLSFLLESAPPAAGGRTLSSEECLLPRQWWQGQEGRPT